jgi:hypothetical protein
MIEHYPDGTAEIPYPHRIFRWKTGNLTLRVETPEPNLPAPKIDGWACFWVSRIGPERTEYTYRPAE